MTIDINYAPIADACADAVDSLADAILDCVHNGQEVKYIVLAVDAAFSLGDISHEINAKDGNSNIWVMATILPCRPSLNINGYTNYFEMLARVANLSPRFKEALQTLSSTNEASYFQACSREILSLTHVSANTSVA